MSGSNKLIFSCFTCAAAATLYGTGVLKLQTLQNVNLEFVCKKDINDGRKDLSLHVRVPYISVYKTPRTLLRGVAWPA